MRPRRRSPGISSNISVRRPRKRFLPPPESSRPVASILDNVDLHDAGDRLILSSQEEATLRYVIEEMRKEGAQAIQPPVKVGSKWVASFENPALSQCTVAKLGFQIIIACPTEGSVLARSDEFRERGALIVHGPEKENEPWKLYLRAAGARTGSTITS